MVDNIAEGRSFQLFFLIVDPVTLCHFGNGFRGISQSNDIRVEETGVLLHHLNLIPFRIKGDKKSLGFLLFLFLHFMKNSTDGGERNRTDIRTGGESEKNQNYLTF